jgi:hypothetical protein
MFFCDVITLTSPHLFSLSIVCHIQSLYSKKKSLTYLVKDFFNLLQRNYYMATKSPEISLEGNSDFPIK